MIDNKSENLETINIGIVGHIDHGKTTLLQKLSGKWTDTHSEELKRGITIKLGYADSVIYVNNGEYNIDGKGKPVRHVSFIDAPGHEMLMATMLSGAAMMDVALLVIAANEGIKPQTREHLMALQAKNVEKIIIIQNKIDLVTKDEAEKNYKSILNFLGDKFKDISVIPVSAQQGINIEEVWKSITEIKNLKRDLKGDPVFVIARSFDINKPGTKPEDLKGTVLGGALKYGKLKCGDRIEIKPGKKVKQSNKFYFEPLKTSIKKLYRGSIEVNELTPGGSLSIETGLDMALGKGDSLGGNVLSIEGNLPEITLKLKLKYSLFKEVLGLGTNIEVGDLKLSEKLMLSINTSTTGGIIKNLKRDVIEMDLQIPVVPFKGDNVGIARNVGGHWRLIGIGEIL